MLSEAKTDGIYEFCTHIKSDIKGEWDKILIIDSLEKLKFKLLETFKKYGDTFYLDGVGLFYVGDTPYKITKSLDK